MIELLIRLLAALRATLRSRADLAAENLLLRHQPAVLARPGRKRPPLCVRDKLVASPTAAWVWRQLIEATPWESTPKYLVRDRDASYGGEFGRRAKRLGIRALLTPIRAPRANAIAGRVVGTSRRECLDHVIVFDERHLWSVLREFVGYHNADRPHRSLGLETPEPAARPQAGPVRSRPVLGGLHHAYERVA